MAAGQDNEVLMQLVDMNGTPLAAECQTEVDTDMDALVFDYFNGTFFAVTEFSFGVNIDDQDPTSDGANPTGRHGVGAAGLHKAPGPQVKFGKWKSGSPEDVKKMTPFPVRMEEFSITRTYDHASPVLFEKCATSDSFKSASLVKRKVTGKLKLESFLRIDFTDVLVTHIEWEDAEVIKETFKFVFRKMLVQFKTQAQDGTLQPAKSYPWEYKAQLKPGGGR